MHYFKATGQFKLELQFPNTQFGWKSAISLAMRPWNLTDDLKTKGHLFYASVSFVHLFIAIDEFKIYSPEKLAIFCPVWTWYMWSWPLTLTFCMGITFVNSNHSWNVHDNTMTGTLSKRCDRQSDGQTDGMNICKAAGSQLKILVSHRPL